MTAVLHARAAAQSRAASWRQRALSFLVPNILYLYARLWHHCRRTAPIRCRRMARRC